MDLATAFEITTGRPAPSIPDTPLESETAREIVARAKRQTDQARDLGWWKHAKELSYAEMNLGNFMRGGSSLEGAKDHVRKGIIALTALAAILEEVDE